MSSPQLRVRLPADLIKILTDEAAQKNITLSDLVFFKVTAPGTAPKTYSDHYKKLRQAKILRIKIMYFHEISRLLFTTKYFIRRILEAAHFSTKISGCPHMPEIHYLRDRALETFKELPQEIQDLKLDEIQYIKNLGSEGYLIDQLKVNRFERNITKYAHKELEQHSRRKKAK